MQTWEAIESRRNVRAFTDQPISAADLDRILEAGRRSPSSQNWQPWDFIVVTDREQLRELSRVFSGAGHVAGSAATIVVVSGTPQSATVGAAFGSALVVKVSDSNGNAVPGATVSFAAPASGATAGEDAC